MVISDKTESNHPSTLRDFLIPIGPLYLLRHTRRVNVQMLSFLDLPANFDFLHPRMLHNLLDRRPLLRVRLQHLSY